jgi:plasmid stabilization system protein ParE
MAAPRIVLSEPARADLEGIWDYLARESSPEIADFVIARLYEAMHRAADTPLIYRKRAEHRGAPRRINVFDYAVFFDSLPEDAGIFVWRILHGARELPSLVHRPPHPKESK